MLERMEKTSSIGHVKNVIHRVMEERNIVNKIKITTNNRIGNVLRRKCLLNHIINPLQTNRRPLYLKTQSVLRCKHFRSRL